MPPINLPARQGVDPFHDSSTSSLSGVPTNLDGVLALSTPLHGVTKAADVASLIADELLGPLRHAEEPGARALRDRVGSHPWRSEDRLVPILEPQPGVTHLLVDAAHVADTAYTSNNWAGGTMSGAWTAAWGVWRIPTVTRPTTPAGAKGGWNSSSWVGIDGTYGSNDVLQAGIQQAVGPDGVASYVAWYEWFAPKQAGSPPYIFQTNIGNFPVSPGDEIICGVEYGNGQGHVHLGNLTNGKYFTLALVAPPGASFSGNSVEWIMEAPDSGEPTTSLPRFTPVHFSDALATGPGGAFGDPAAGDTINVLRNGKSMTTVALGLNSVTIDYVGDDPPPRIGFNPQDRFMLTLGQTLVVVTANGDVFGADVVSRRLQPVFQYTGAKIGFNPQDRFMLTLGQTLVVVTADGNVFGADVTGRHIGPVYQFTGAKIGFNPQDRFMLTLGHTLVVVTANGDVFGADVTGRQIGPVYQFTGAKIGFNRQDRFMLARNKQLAVVTSSGDVFGADVSDIMGTRPDRPGSVVVGRELGPVYHYTGAKIGYNPGDRFMLTAGQALMVVTNDGDVFGVDVMGNNLTPVYRITV